MERGETMRKGKRKKKRRKKMDTAGKVAERNDRKIEKTMIATK